jgi:hypothetical protein
MAKEDYDKTIGAIETICNIIEGVEEAKTVESAGGEKITWTETTGIVVKNGVGAVKAIANIGEIGRELADTDADEASEAIGIIFDHFGGSPEAKAACQKVSSGAALMYEGTKELIALRKASKNQV